MHLDIRCPACGHQGIHYNTATTDIPYFGECMETLIKCTACGFRHTDVQMLAQKEPMRHRMEVEHEADLSARVVRSTSGTIRIPQLGVTIEPGPMSESFVTNVEGVLERVVRVLGQLSRSGNAEQREKAEAMLVRIAGIREGAEPITLIVEDPFGNSAIAHPNAVMEDLTEEEVSQLKTGTHVIDLEDLENAAEEVRDGGGKDDDDGFPDVDDLLRP